MVEESKARRVLGRVPGVHALSGGTDRLVAAQQQRLDANERQLAAQNESLRDLTAAVGAVSEHLPNVLNVIASHHGTQRRLKHNIDEVQAGLQRQVDSVQEQLASHQDQIGDVGLRFDDPETGTGQAITALWERIEMVRRELLFELRYSFEAGGSVGDGSLTAEVGEPRIVDQAKVEAMAAEGLRVNLGCGHIALEGYVNVDMRELPGVDVVASVDRLPFEPASVAEVFSAHVLEHFPLEQLRRQLLPYWVGLLRPGGVFRAIVPDSEAMVRRYEAGEMPFEQFREVFFGGQEYEGDFHFNMFTAEFLGELLREAGLVEVEVEAEDQPNGLCYEFQIAATRPA
jgi:predicted SAM-dependent methyltransferase